MPDEFAQNSWQPDQSEQSKAAMPSVSAPPVEVSIRTMSSDLASLGETGGGPPHPMSVAVPSLSRIEQPAAMPKENVEVLEEGVRPPSKSRFLFLGFLVLLGAGGLFLG